jgi:hypothetical protein
MEEQSEQRLEQRIERHETKMDYHHHTLWLRSYALKVGGWVPKVVVIIPEEEGNGERELLLDDQVFSACNLSIIDFQGVTHQGGFPVALEQRPTREEDH